MVQIVNGTASQFGEDRVVRRSGPGLLAPGRLSNPLTIHDRVRFTPGDFPVPLQIQLPGFALQHRARAEGAAISKNVGKVADLPTTKPGEHRSISGVRGIPLDLFGPSEIVRDSGRTPDHGRLGPYVSPVPKHVQLPGITLQVRV